MNIYSFPTFNLAKILITAEELNLDYHLHLLDAKQGDHKTPAHCARHPLGKVPTIEIDGQHYIESNSICRLLAERNENRLYGNTPEQHALINQWMDLMALHTGRWMGAYFFEQGVKPHLIGSEPNNDKLDEAAGFLKEQLPVIEQTLQAQSFLTGETLTIADIVAFSYCLIQEYTQLNFDDYPAIERWYQLIKARPSYARAMQQSPHGEMTPY